MLRDLVISRRSFEVIAAVEDVIIPFQGKAIEKGRVKRCTEGAEAKR
jgi:hypothetical protein